jgi:hypothetical protein
MWVASAVTCTSEGLVPLRGLNLGHVACSFQQGSIKENLNCHLCSSTVCPRFKELGYQYTLSVVFIMRLIAMPCAQRTKHTHLMESSSDAILHLRQSLFTTHETKDTTNRTVTALIPIVCNLWFTPLSNMIAAYSYPFIKTRLHLLVNCILRAHVWPRYTPRLVTPNPALL